MNDLTRMTVNLSPRAVVALNQLTAIDGCDKTDAVNRAVVGYSYLLRKSRSEGAVLKLHYASGAVEAVTFL